MLGYISKSMQTYKKLKYLLNVRLYEFNGICSKRKKNRSSLKVFTPIDYNRIILFRLVLHASRV